MFRPKPVHVEQVARLSHILAAYNKIAHQDPIQLKQLLPAQEIWRFFIDGCLQNGRGLAKGLYFQSSHIDLTIKQYIETQEKIKLDDKKAWLQSPLWQFLLAHHWQLSANEAATLTLKDLLGLDRGWLPFEANEPGYIKALVGAFQTIFDFSTHVDNAFIKKMHALAISQVKHTEYEEEWDDNPDEFRSNSRAYFRFSNTKVTEAFVKQIIEQNHSHLSIHLTISDPELQTNIARFPINQESMHVMREYLADEKNKQEIDSESYRLAMELLTKLSVTTNATELAHCLWELITNPSPGHTFALESFQPDKPHYTLTKTMERFLEIYNLAISAATTPLDKLHAIIRVVQASERLHPFKDANTRTFSMLILNHLLLRNGFPPAILLNPNQMGTSSDLEALELVLDGMENTLKLAKGEKLFSVDTSEILNFLQSHDYLADKFSYFNEVISIEQNSRNTLQRVVNH